MAISAETDRRRCASPADKIEAAKVKLGTTPLADMLELGAPVATYRYFDTHATMIASVVRFEPDGNERPRRSGRGATGW